MGISSSRNYNYHQYYNAVKNTNFDFSTIDYEKLNPYEVLNVSKKFTWNELKEAYKNTALLTHPDKEGGNKIVFDFVTDCFKYLALEYKNREIYKSHDEMRNNSLDYFKNNNDSFTLPDIELNNGNFTEKFNKTFEKCKIDDEDINFGYGDFMEKSSKNRDDINIDKLYNNDKFNASSFNDIFNKHIPLTKDLIKFKEPQPLLLAKNIQFSEIGAKKTDDYSSSVENSSRNNLVYTDYMKAYTNTRLVDPDIIKSRKDFKDVSEYEKYRDTKIKKELTNKEKKYIENKKEKEEREEYLRLERIKDRDKIIELNHQKASRLLIK